MNATEAYQRAFAAHLRDPAANPPPAGVDAARAGVYVELLFNNVDDFLSNCFPVIRSILDDNAWDMLVRRFYAEHACATPYFREIPAEFVQWLTSVSLSDRLFAERSRSVPFLLELAHYEWVEIPLTLADAPIDWQQINPDGDLLDGVPILNPVMLLQSYQYPVHRISMDYQPHTPDPTHLLLIRNPEHKIDFIVLNAITARLLQRLQEGSSARQALTQIAEEIQHPNTEQLLEFGLTLLHQFQQQRVLLGVMNPSTA